MCTRQRHALKVLPQTGPHRSLLPLNTLSLHVCVSCGTLCAITNVQKPTSPASQHAATPPVMMMRGCRSLVALAIDAGPRRYLKTVAASKSDSMRVPQQTRQ